MAEESLIGQIEAILFASGDYVLTEKLCALTSASRKQVLDALKQIDEKYKDNAIMLQQQGEGWKFHVRNSFMPVVENIIQNTELTKSVMETLAVIAWKAPIMQAELVKIRTNKAYDHIGELLEKQFITKEKSGRTFVIKLTPKFFEYFDIGSRDEIKQIFESIEDKPKNQHILPQKKVIDFDGTPRTAAMLTEQQATTLEVIDEEQLKAKEQQRKQDQVEDIQNVRSEHISHLEELDQILHGKEKERNDIISDIHDQIPTEETPQSATQPDIVEGGSMLDDDLQDENKEEATLSTQDFQEPQESQDAQNSQHSQHSEDKNEEDIEKEVEKIAEELDEEVKEIEQDSQEQETAKVPEEDKELMDEIIEEADTWDVPKADPDKDFEGIQGEKEELKSSSLEDQLTNDSDSVDPYAKLDKEKKHFEELHEKTDEQEAEADEELLDEASGEKSVR